MALEGILVNGVTEILKKLLPVISQQISQAWGVKDERRKLEKTLESIQAVIADAEEKQITDATVRLWLRRLKGVVYDADDVMDEFCYETMRRCVRGSQLKHKVHDFISKSSNPLVFHFKMAGKIRAIRKSLDEIYNDEVRYTLNATCTGTSLVDRTREQRNRLTTSVVDDSVFIGREHARSCVVKMLTEKSTLPSVTPSSSSSHNSSRQEKLSVVSIVGMGGLGKTSLAQLVYQDKSIKLHFEPKIWVCVSHKFDVYRILKDIVESITLVSCGDPSNVDVLARQVKEKLMGKKYLLVLDDLWNEDTEDWEKLKGVLVNGVEGSKLLVTTRSQKVASVIGGGAVLTQSMTNIGREIAKKCDGLPLAANFLGSLLYLNREESYWVSINNDRNLWVQPENIRVISILKLSYDNLASPLKQCFSYCCLFPKDWEIKRETLIRMWLAEGFLQSNEVNNRSLEDIGNDYFEFLLWNSFFQEVKQDELGVIHACKMHDIVHDLAMSIADCNEFGIDGKEDASQVRRLQLICDRGSSATTAKVLSKAKNLRTVVVLHPKNYSSISSLSSVKHLRVLYPLGLWDTKFSLSISKFKHLRFLDLSNCEFDLAHDVSLNHSHNLQTLVLHSCSNVSGFLGAVGPLNNLRHLDISKSDIKVLHDDFIVNLTNLQTLDLNGCCQFEALPENMGLLKHLRYLNLSHSSISKIPDSIACISSLTTLNFVGCRKLNALPTELGALTRLRCLDLSGSEIKVLPESCISNLCNLEIVDFGYACELPKEIKNWPKLRRFSKFTFYDDSMHMPRGIEKLTCLETLMPYLVRKEADSQVCGSSGSTQNNCSSGNSGLEELAALNSLQLLWIERLENVRGGIEEAARAKLKDKTNLRDLHLGWSLDEDGEDWEDGEDGEDAEDWEDGEDGEDAEDWEDGDMVLEGLQPHPNLRSLQIFGYSGFKLPKWMGSTSSCLVSLCLNNFKWCETLPALGMLPCLRDLDIDNMESVKCLGREFYHQQEEEEESSSTQNSTATTSSLFPSLVYLNLTDMENLEEWVASPSSYFYVDSFPLLESLYVQDCPILRSTPNSFPSLKSLQFLRTNGKAVNSILSVSRVGCLTSLTSIYIEESPELIYFPLGVLFQDNTPNLHSLWIRSCSEFRGFRDDDGDLNNNNNSTNVLHKLELLCCPVLTSLPDLRLWTSLRELYIRECDKLKEYIPYDLKTSLSFLESLKVDFIQREDKRLGDPDNVDLINLMEK